MSKPIQDISGKAQIRLGKRDRPRSARGKHANQVVVAIARELRAFMWAIAQEVPLAPSTEPLAVRTPFAPDFARLSEETQPRCGVALDGVRKPVSLPQLAAVQIITGS